jgi:nucleoside 2-deoxyribosyltransferase
MAKLVYLAGGISGLSWEEATAWRVEACHSLSEFGILGLSPLRAKSYLLSKTSIADHYNEHVLSTQKGITTRDRWDCQRSSVVLFNLVGAKTVSIGTCIEYGWADAARVPIITCMEPGGLHDHAMVREVSGFIVPTLEEGIETVKALLS